MLESLDLAADIFLVKSLFTGEKERSVSLRVYLLFWVF